MSEATVANGIGKAIAGAEIVWGYSIICEGYDYPLIFVDEWNEVLEQIDNIWYDGEYVFAADLDEGDTVVVVKRASMTRREFDGLNRDY